MGVSANDMTGKTVMVTGATSGIGEATALELARLGARVLVHGRDKLKATDAADRIRAAVPGADPLPVAGDLSSLIEVRRLAESVMRATARLDVLVNNAGTYCPSCVATVDGLETTFAVNHIAAFALTALLDDLLSASAPSRIVTVSSVAHFRGVLNLDEEAPPEPYVGYAAYAASKLANVLFAVEAASRFFGTGVTSNTLHPGVTDTKLLHRVYPDQHGGDAFLGAATSVYLASAPEVEDVTGRYFVNQHPAKASPLADDRAVRARLWDLSQRLGGVAAR